MSSRRDISAYVGQRLLRVGKFLCGNCRWNSSYHNGPSHLDKIDIKFYEMKCLLTVIFDRVTWPFLKVDMQHAWSLSAQVKILFTSHRPFLEFEMQH